MTHPTPFDAPRRVPFAGADYQDRRDRPRLETQLDQIRAVMSDGLWRTLGGIEGRTGFPQASISAQLRNLRKLGITVERRHVGGGLYQYRVVP